MAVAAASSAELVSLAVDGGGGGQFVSVWLSVCTICLSVALCVCVCFCHCVCVSVTVYVGQHSGGRLLPSVPSMQEAVDSVFAGGGGGGSDNGGGVGGWGGIFEWSRCRWRSTVAAASVDGSCCE